MSSLAEATPLTATRDVWRAGDKLLKSYKLFGREHQNIRGFVKEVLAKLEAHFQRFGPLEVVLASSEVLVAGEKLLRDEAAEKNFILPLAQAGVVRLRFEPGLDLPELERFFKVLSTDAKTAEADLLAELWMGALPHVKWTVVSELDAADPKDVASASWIRAAFQILDYAKAPQFQKAPPRPPSLDALARDGLAELTQVPGPPGDKAVLSEPARAQLAHALESDGEIAARAVRYVLEAIPSPRTEDVALVSPLVVPAVEALLEEKAFTAAEELLASLERWPLSPAQRGGLFAKDSARLAARALRGVATGEGAAACAALVRHLGPGIAPALVDALAGTVGEARARLLSALKSFGGAACAAIEEKLLGLEEPDALQLFALAVEIGGPAAVDVFDTAVHHGSARVAAEGKRRAPPANVFSPGRAIAGLASERGTVRAQALDFFAKQRFASAAGAVEAACGAEAFRDYEEPERRRFLETLAMLDRERALGLGRRMLAEKSLLGGAKQDALRATAAWLLGQLKDGESRAALEELAQGRARPELKKACEEALRKL